MTKEFNILMGSNISDVACGMYFVRTKKMKEILFDRHGFEVNQEIASQMLVNGKVTTVPIAYRSRLRKAKAPTWRQGFRALFAIAGIAKRYSPVVLFGLFAAVAVVPTAALFLDVAYMYVFEGFSRVTKHSPASCSLS